MGKTFNTIVKFEKKNEQIIINVRIFQLQIFKPLSTGKGGNK